MPDALRGKVATLRFELTGGEVYVDNVFFKSQHLLLGNPTEARKPDNADSYSSNYLLEKPQYVVSYNKDNQTANWVSHTLNKSWIDGRRIDNFSEDVTLPSDWYQVPGEAYKQSDSYAYARGHLAPAADLYRTRKDNTAANVMTNLVPQNSTNNSGFWQTLEGDLRDGLVDDRNKELYITTGVLGDLRDELGNPIRITKPTESPGLDVKVPASLWKVVLVQDRPGLGLSDIDGQTLAFAIYAPNDSSVRGNNWRSSTNYILSVRELEGLTNYDFFSNLSSAVQDQIENRARATLLQDITALFSSPIASAPLLSGLDGVDAFRPTSIISDRAIWHSGTTEDIRFQGSEVDSTLQIGISEVSTAPIRLHIADSQVSFSKVSSVSASSNQLAPSQIRFVEQSSIQTGIPEASIAQVRFAQISSDQLTSSEVSSNQVSSRQASAGQIRSTQASITQVGSIQISSNHFRTFEFSSREVDFPQIDINQVSFSDIHPTEISLPSSITLQQFLSSHNFNLQNTTIPTWTEFLAGTTPFNLNIAITDLPTGQLAEANITGFDTTGRPTSGTLTHLLRRRFANDHDGNNLGWF